MSLSDRLATARDRAELQSIASGAAPTMRRSEDVTPPALKVTDALAAVWTAVLQRRSDGD